MLRIKAFIPLSLVLFSLSLVGCGWNKVSQSDKIKGTLRFGFYTMDKQGCAVGDDGILLARTKGKNRWTTVIGDSSDVHSHHHLNTAEMVNSDVWVAAGALGRFYVTQNGGEDWTLVQKSFNEDGKAVCRFSSFADTKAGWVSTGQVLAETADLGKTWKEIPLPQNVDRITTISCTGQGSGFIVDRKLDLYQTADAGKNWTKIGQVSDPSVPGLDNPFGEQNQVIAVRAVGSKLILAYSAKVGEEGWLIMRESGNNGKDWKTTGKIKTGTGTVYLSHDGQVTHMIPGKNFTVYRKL